jgi:hypothetical protein
MVRVGGLDINPVFQGEHADRTKLSLLHAAQNCLFLVGEGVDCPAVFVPAEIFLVL